MDIQDLTGVIFEEVHHEMRLLFGSHLITKPNAVQATQWSKLMKKRFMRLWIEKWVSFWPVGKAPLVWEREIRDTRVMIQKSNQKKRF